MRLYGSKDLGFRHWLPTNSSSWPWTIESSGENFDFNPQNLFELKSQDDNEEDGISVAAIPLIVTIGVLILFFAVLGVVATGQKVVQLVGGGGKVPDQRCRCQLAEKHSLMKSSEEDPINTV